MDAIRFSGYRVTKFITNDRYMSDDRVQLISESSPDDIPSSSMVQLRRGDTTTTMWDSYTGNHMTTFEALKDTEKEDYIYQLRSGNGCSTDVSQKDRANVRGQAIVVPIPAGVFQPSVPAKMPKQIPLSSYKGK